MATEDGRYVLTYNGEVYNHVALRAELEASKARRVQHGTVTLDWTASTDPVSDPPSTGVTAYGVYRSGDSIVANNLVLNLYQHVNAPEARMYLSRQLAEEALASVVRGFLRAAQELLVGVEADQALGGAMALAEAEFGQLFGHEGGEFLGGQLRQPVRQGSAERPEMVVRVHDGQGRLQHVLGALRQPRLVDPVMRRRTALLRGLCASGTRAARDLPRSERT